MLKFFILISFLQFIPYPSYGQSREKIEAVSSAIKRLDGQIVTHIFLLEACEDAMHGDSRPLWSLHRTYAVSSLELYIQDGNASLLRFEDIWDKAKQSRAKPPYELDFCLAVLNQMMHETDVAKTKYLSVLEN